MIFVFGLMLTFLVVSLRLQFGYSAFPFAESTIGRLIIAGLWALIGTGLGIIAGMGAAALIDTMSNQTYCDNPVNTQLYSMRGDNNLTGSFLFIDSEYTYHYFDSNDGAISEHNLDGQVGEVFEDSTRETAHVANYSFEYQWYWRPFVIGNGGWGCETQFHVPPGSVSRAIQVNP